MWLRVQRGATCDTTSRYEYSAWLCAWQVLDTLPSHPIPSPPWTTPPIAGKNEIYQWAIVGTQTFGSHPPSPSPLFKCLPGSKWTQRAPRTDRGMESSRRHPRFHSGARKLLKVSPLPMSPRRKGMVSAPCRARTSHNVPGRIDLLLDPFGGGAQRRPAGQGPGRVQRTWSVLTHVACRPLAPGPCWSSAPPTFCRVHGLCGQCFGCGLVLANRVNCRGCFSLLGPSGIARLGHIPDLQIRGWAC